MNKPIEVDLNSDNNLGDMLALLHQEVIYTMSLMAGLYPKPYVDEHIVPKIEEFIGVGNQLLGIQPSVDSTTLS